MRKFFLYPLSLLIIGSLLLQETAAFAEPLASLAKPQPQAINISSELALTRKNVVSASQGETIIHLQDAHSKLGAQESISKILDTLVKNYDLKMVALEGASDYVDTSLVSSFPIEKAKENVANSLLKEGKISASEFYSMLTKEKVNLYGVEDSSLYKQNVEVFKSLIEQKPKIRQELKNLKQTLKALGDQIYSPKLKTLLNQRLLHQNGDIKFTEYWDTFSKEAKLQGIDFHTYPNLDRLSKAIDLEETIDFKQASLERDLLIETLGQLLKKEDLKDLVLKSLEFKKNKISPTIFHALLFEKAAQNNLQQTSFPNLSLYTQYVSLYESIDLIQIFDEVESFEEALKTKLFENDTQRTLSRLQKSSSILSQLLDTTLTSKDYSFFIQNQPACEIEAIGQALQTLCETYKVPNTANFDYLKTQIPSAKQFYELAEARNKALLENTLKKMRQTGQKIAALVTGGFHTEGLTQLMDQQKLSYLVVMPKFDEKSPDRPYFTVLTQKPREQEELFKEGEEFYVAAPVMFDTANPRFQENVRPVTRELFQEGRMLEPKKNPKMIAKEYARNYSLNGARLSVNEDDSGFEKLEEIRRDEDLNQFDTHLLSIEIDLAEFEKIEAGMSNFETVAKKSQELATTEKLLASMKSLLKKTQADLIKKIIEREKGSDPASPALLKMFEDAENEDFSNSIFSDIFLKKVQKEKVESVTRFVESLAVKIDQVKEHIRSLKERGLVYLSEEEANSKIEKFTTRIHEIDSQVSSIFYKIEMAKESEIKSLQEKLENLSLQSDSIWNETLSLNLNFQKSEKVQKFLDENIQIIRSSWTKTKEKIQRYFRGDELASLAAIIPVKDDSEGLKQVSPLKVSPRSEAFNFHSILVKLAEALQISLDHPSLDYFKNKKRQTIEAVLGFIKSDRRGFSEDSSSAQAFEKLSKDTAIPLALIQSMLKEPFPWQVLQTFFRERQKKKTDSSENLKRKVQDLTAIKRSPFFGIDKKQLDMRDLEEIVLEKLSLEMARMLRISKDALAQQKAKQLPSSSNLPTPSGLIEVPKSLSPVAGVPVFYVTSAAAVVARKDEWEININISGDYVFTDFSGRRDFQYSSLNIRNAQFEMISASELKISKQTVYIKRKGTASVVRVNEFKLVNALNSYQDWTALLYAAHLKVTSHHPIYQAPTPILVPDEHQTPAELPPPPADKQDRKVTSIFGTESIFKDKLGALERFKKAIRIIDQEGGDIDKQIDGNDSLASFIQEARNELSDWKNNHKELLSSMDGVITPVEKIKTAKKKETKIKMSWADLYRKFLTSEAVIKIDLGNRFWPDALHHVYTSGIKNSFYDQFVLETQAGLPVKFYPQSTFNLEINDGYEDLNGFIGPAFLDGKRAVQPIVYGDGMKARTLGKFMNMDASREIIIKDPHSDKGFSSKTLWINSEFNSLIETLEKTRLGNPSQVAIAKDFISPLKELEEILKEVFIEELKSLKPAYPIAPQATLKKIVSDLEAELRSKAAIGGARLTGIPESPLSDSELKAALEFLRSDLQDHWIGKANLFWSSKGYGITINDAILKVVDPSYQTPVAVSQELKTIVTTSGIFEKDADGLAYAPRVRRVGARLGYQNILLVTKPVSGITEAEKIDNYLKEYPAASVFGYIKFGQAKKVSDLKQICSNFLTNEFILIAKEEEAITASNLDTQKLLELDPRADSTINILEEAANLLAGSAITKAAQKTTNGWTLWPKASKEYLKLIELVKQAKEVIGVAA